MIINSMSDKSNLQIKYKVIKTENKGIALMADEFIPKNTLIWKPSSNNTFYKPIEFKEYISKMSDNSQIKYILEHVYCWKQYIIELNDDSQYTNHSSNPNMYTPVNDKEGCAYSIRDIQKGEELTEDYSKYDLIDEYTELCKKRGVYNTHEISKLFN